jgi:hypothetical protein
MRIISIILTELASDKLKAEERLQRFINDKGDVDENIIKIKNELREIALLDEMILKWRSYTEDSDIDNNNK